MSILVTGGAGYIGSHIVRYLVEQGQDVVVIDNLVLGHRESVHESVCGKAKFYETDLCDVQAVAEVMRREAVESVIHFAAFSQVGESMAAPDRYFRNNVYGTMCLLDAMIASGVRNIVFSSTAAVYGEGASSASSLSSTPSLSSTSSSSLSFSAASSPELSAAGASLGAALSETSPLCPTNPYGESKLMMEKMLKWYAKAYGISYVALRYFNAAGAHHSGEIGERHEPETHLIPIILQCAAGERDTVRIFGTDYPTPDGTCIRDYIHVEDLAEAHFKALLHLMRGGSSECINLGSGTGYSVRTVVDTVARITGKEIPVLEEARRQGDPAVLIADVSKARRLLDFTARRTLDDMIRDAWNFYRKHAPAKNTSSKDDPKAIGL